MSPKVAAATRHYLVTIQEKSDSEPDSGYPVETFSDLGPDVWMSREIQSTFDTERFAAGQLSAQAREEWYMPYRADMDPNLVDVPSARRLVCQGRDHDIVAARIEGRREAIVLTTIAKVG